MHIRIRLSQPARSATPRSRERTPTRHRTDRTRRQLRRIRRRRARHRDGRHRNRRGRRRDGATFPGASYGLLGLTTDGFVTDLVVDERGCVAWIVESIRFREHVLRLRETVLEVRMASPSGESGLVDSGAQIASRSPRARARGKRDLGECGLAALRIAPPSELRRSDVGGGRAPRRAPNSVPSQH